MTALFQKAYVPEIELTAGQPAPIAANGGLSYMSFDQDGDAGTRRAISDALALIEAGDAWAATSYLDDASSGPIETKWGIGFRRFSECMAYIRESGMHAPEGGIVVPLRYTVNEHPSYSIVPSNALWKDKGRAADANLLRQDERAEVYRCLYFPQVLRDARRIQEY